MHTNEYPHLRQVFLDQISLADTREIYHLGVLG